LKPKNVVEHGNDVAKLEAERAKLLEELPPKLRKLIKEKEDIQKVLGDAAREHGPGSSISITERRLNAAIRVLEDEIDRVIEKLKP
jgi:hypothetical protein